MSSTQELKEVIKDTLSNRGVLGQIKARIRAEVFNSLDDHTEPKPPLSNENMIINELIREYLEFNKYKYSASVLVAESGQPKQPLDRRFLTEELNIEEDRNSADVPLLYGLVAQFMGRNKSIATRTALQARGQSSRFIEDLENEMGKALFCLFARFSASYQLQGKQILSQSPLWSEVEDSDIK